MFLSVLAGQFFFRKKIVTTINSYISTHIGLYMASNNLTHFTLAAGAYSIAQLLADKIDLDIVEIFPPEILLSEARKKLAESEVSNG